MNRDGRGLALVVHLGVIALLFALQFVLPAYHHGVLARVLVLAVYAMGYNILFGYTGLLSLGHAMFFGAGLYGAGLAVYHFGWSPPPAFAAGIVCGIVLSAAVGVLALRTTGVAFLIVTLMFGQIFYLVMLFLADYTGGDDGLVVAQAGRTLEIAGFVFDPTDPVTRYFLAWALFSLVLLFTLGFVRRPLGRILVAVRENEERTIMLGYNTFAAKLSAVVVSGGVCAAAGAAYALIFGYVGATFVEVHYSILPLLWVLVGGAGTVLGPLVGTVLMFYLVDISSDVLNARFPDWDISYLGVVGVALILLVLLFPKGIMGTLRERAAPWLP